LRLEFRKDRTTHFVKEVINYSGSDHYGVEIAIPQIYTYNHEKVVKEDIKSVLSSHKFNPYKDTPKTTKIFRKSYYESLSHFPKLNFDNTGSFHSLANFFYSNYVYLREDSVYQSYLNKLPFTKKAAAFSKRLVEVVEEIEQTYGLRLDLWAVPKRNVGSFVHVADSDGYSRIAKILGFGFHKTFPQDRIARESSSLKDAYRFSKPNHHIYKINEIIAPYVTFLKVAVIFPRDTMADGGEYFESAIPKISCKFFKEKEIELYDNTHPTSVLDLNISSSSVSIRRIIKTEVDESTYLPGPLRFVIPGGIKICASPNTQQAFDNKKEPIDLLLDYRTFVSKGAIGTLMMLQGGLGKVPTMEEAYSFFENNLSYTNIKIGQDTLPALVGYLPVFRPSQSYLTLCKPGPTSLDLVSRVVADLPLKPKESTDKIYTELSKLYRQLSFHE